MMQERLFRSSLSSSKKMGVKKKGGFKERRGDRANQKTSRQSILTVTLSMYSQHESGTNRWKQETIDSCVISYPFILAYA